MEIERKYKIRQLPEHLEQYEKKEIEQAYLCARPVVRIRKSNDRYILTYKSRLGLAETDCTARVCQELEAELTEEAYYHLREKADGYYVTKYRYLIPLEQGLTAELDLFRGRLEGLVFAEVEFPDEEAAGQFIPPAWFGEEVSQDPRYSNQYLSTLSELALMEQE